MPDPDDVPSPIDLCDPAVAHTWAREADAKRPWRAQVRNAFAEIIGGMSARRVLELGSGPGLLAERILRSCAVESYTLFDFSQPMLDLSRERVRDRAATFVLGDFKQPDWGRAFAEPFDAIVTMQAVHELRHKRHATTLYRQIHELLWPEGRLLVCDHVPVNDSGLYSTEAEHHAAMIGAGFLTVTTEALLHGLYLISALRARSTT